MNPNRSMAVQVLTNLTKDFELFSRFRGVHDWFGPGPGLSGEAKPSRIFNLIYFHMNVINVGVLTTDVADKTPIVIVKAREVNAVGKKK